MKKKIFLIAVFILIGFLYIQNRSSETAHLEKAWKKTMNASSGRITKGNRVCSHKRLYGRRGQYSTLPEHMPANHQLYSEWDKARFLKWASGIGEATHQVIQGIFDSYRIEEQAYKGCLSLLKLADKYTPERLEYACKAALERIPSPRYKNIRLILESGNDKTAAPSARSPKTIHDESYALVRGASYYGGGSHEE